MRIPMAPGLLLQALRTRKNPYSLVHSIEQDCIQLDSPISQQFNSCGLSLLSEKLGQNLQLPAKGGRNLLLASKHCFTLLPNQIQGAGNILIKHTQQPNSTTNIEEIYNNIYLDVHSFFTRASCS
jgi:hypothetical protein